PSVADASSASRTSWATSRNPAPSRRAKLLPRFIAAWVWTRIANCLDPRIAQYPWSISACNRFGNCSKMRSTLSILAALMVPVFAVSAEIQVGPSNIILTGPRASQRLVVVAASEGKATADLTGQAQFQSSDPKIAEVDDKGIVRAKGDGMVTIRASVGSDQAT